MYYLDWRLFHSPSSSILPLRFPNKYVATMLRFCYHPKLCEAVQTYTHLQCTFVYLLIHIHPFTSQILSPNHLTFMILLYLNFNHCHSICFHLLTLPNYSYFLRMNLLLYWPFFYSIFPSNISYILDSL